MTDRIRFSGDAGLSGAALALCLVAMPGSGSAGVSDACSARSGDKRTPVLELYTSEGCSSCPPADKWISTLAPQVRGGEIVAQAFHVGYWDYIGWVDRFAAPAHTARQRELAARAKSTTVYTPQVARDGADVRDYARAGARGNEPARATIAIERTAAHRYEASVVPVDPGQPWSAYWSVTEDGHTSRVTAGENAGESLRHDFVVRQYVPLGSRKGEAKLPFNALPAQPTHARRVNLVVFDPVTGKPLQALGIGC